MRRSIITNSAIWCVVILISCDNVQPPAVAPKDTLSKKVNDSLVMKGTGAVYAYKPDSAYNGLVMGNAESFAAYWKENGASMNDAGNGIHHCVYLTKENKELVTVSVVKNKKGKEVPYAIDIRKYNKQPLPPDLKVFNGFKLHYISAAGIYIGMFPGNVMTVYTDQYFVKTIKGDTMCLEYRPKEKDKKYYTAYPWDKVVVRYKFVDDYLRRIEYYIDPDVFRDNR